jgi:hypothetical protein
MCALCGSGVRACAGGSSGCCCACLFVPPQGLRPQWPPDCFPHLEYLGKRCIAHNPGDRPSFT